MKLTNGRVFFLNQVMDGLVQFDKAQTLKLSGLTRLAIARNARKLAEAYLPLEQTRNSIVRQRGLEGKKEADDPEGFAEANTEWQKVSAEDSGVRLTIIKASALNLDENGIPIQLILAMGDMIEDDLDPDAKPRDPSANVVPIAAGKA